MSNYEAHIGKKLAYDGCIFTIKSLGMKVYSCKEKCQTFLLNDGMKGKIDCYDCPIPVINGKITAFELILNVVVTNKCDEDGWFVGDEYVKLVDDNGFAHPGFVLCENIPYIPRANSCDRIKRRTQADMVYLFPGLNENSIIQALLLDTGGGSARLDLEKSPIANDIFSEEEYDKVLNRPGTPLPEDEWGRMIEQIEEEEEAEIILAKAHALQKMTDQLIDTLYSIGPRNVDSSIIDKQRVFTIASRERIEAFEEERDTNYRKAPAVIQEAMDEFQRVVDDFKRREEEWRQYTRRPRNSSQKPPTPKPPISKPSAKTEPEIRLEPDNNFEDRCIKLLKAQGYSDIKRLDSTIINGVNLSASRYGLNCIVFGQNKESIVDVDIVQQLVEAMAKTKTPRGVFITTGRFTRAAEFKAMSESIDLIDSERIKSLGILM